MADFNLSGNRNMGRFVITEYRENSGVYRWVIDKFGTHMSLPQYLYSSDMETVVISHIDEYIQAGAYYNFSTPYASKAVIFNEVEINGNTEYHGICLRTDKPLSDIVDKRPGEHLYYDFCICDSDGTIRVRSGLGYSHEFISISEDSNTNFLTYTRNTDYPNDIRVCADYNIESAVSTASYKTYGSFGNPSVDMYQYFTKNNNYIDLGAIYPQLGASPDFSISSTGQGSYDNKSDIVSIP